MSGGRVGVVHSHTVPEVGVPNRLHPPNHLFNIYKTLPSFFEASRWTRILLQPVFHSGSSTLDLSFSWMLCLLAQPVLCFFDPSWLTRHIDFQVYTIKLQPRS